MINTNECLMLNFNSSLGMERRFYKFCSTKPLEVPYLHFDTGRHLYHCVTCIMRHDNNYYDYYYN